MSGQPERVYALEQLTRSRAVILKECAELLANRGKIEQYRETNLTRAQDTVNAQVIGRLMNNVRMGYYPTDPDNIDWILKGIRFPRA